jgi:hypothetical protein
MFSTSSRSIVTLATSREEQHAPAVGDDVDVLGDVRAEEQQPVGAAWPSTVSLPSPGSHWNTSSPAPMKATSLPLSPKTKSSSAPPKSVSLPWEPRIVSSPVPPSNVSLMTPAGQRGGGDAVVAAEGVDGEARRWRPSEW